ncbi:MAG: hypothetical protein ACAI35_14660 [Candidatus Methylacidiphilales bacterium]|nr:hypothetical protein [Candidatus Methylacidiphilales bacterium]
MDDAAAATASPGLFVQFLQENRDALNAQYLQQRMMRPQLEDQDFRTVLTQVLGPLVDAVAEVDLRESGECGHPQRVFEVAEVLYTMALDLTSRDLLGPGARNTLAQVGWAELLMAVANLVAEDAGVMAAAVTNAIYNISEVTGARADEWLLLMMELGPKCENVAQFLEAGKVAAWRAGCAHYRAGALEAVRRLPEPMARKLLGLKSLEEWRHGPALADVLERIEADPWLNPRLAGLSFAHSRVRIVKVAGGFRGLGGLFVTPPRMGLMQNGALAAIDSEGCWQLHADVFGAVFIRQQSRVAGANVLLDKESSWQISSKGEVWHEGDGTIEQFPELLGAWSCVEDGKAVAVTSMLSHRVYILARAADPELG